LLKSDFLESKLQIWLEYQHTTTTPSSHLLHLLDL